ncbi:cytochrome P450 [Xylaria acuta]|nr:cytochrome P450 [Xylaria acuta]
MHTTSLTMQGLIQNLAATDSSLSYIEILREECRAALEEAGGTWTRDAVQKLRLVDSTIRESLRVSPFIVFGLPRKVIDPQGIIIDADNSKYHIRSGKIISLPIEHTHYDEDLYPEAHQFNIFRFSHTRAETGSGESGLESSTAKPAVTLDDQFLTFGYGKHGCPGRFFAVHLMKLILAHILLNYDIQYTKTKPAWRSISWLKLPVNKTTVQIRRRTKAHYEAGP